LLHAAVGFIRAGFDTDRVSGSLAGNNRRAVDIVMLYPCSEWKKRMLSETPLVIPAYRWHSLRWF
jgi:hypothetical protein